MFTVNDGNKDTQAIKSGNVKGLIFSAVDAAIRMTITIKLGSGDHLVYNGDALNISKFEQNLNTNDVCVLEFPTVVHCSSAQYLQIEVENGSGSQIEYAFFEGTGSQTGLPFINQWLVEGGVLNFDKTLEGRITKMGVIDSNSVADSEFPQKPSIKFSSNGVNNNLSYPLAVAYTGCILESSGGKDVVYAYSGSAVPKSRVDISFSAAVASQKYYVMAKGIK